MITKNKNYVTNNFLLKILFIIYLLAMTWIILFKMSFSFELLSSNRNINLIPFRGSVIVNGHILLSEIINNVIIFIPFGIYVSSLFSNLSIIKKISIIISLSVIYETLQYILAIGATDITDVITNTSGGIIGLFVYFIISKLFKTEKKALTFVTACAGFFTVCTIIFISILIIVNL